MTYDEAVQTLYRYAARSAHPDVGGSNQAMTEVNQAVEVLRVGRPARVTSLAPRPPAAELVLDFGKHRGRRLADVPIDYLDWCAVNLRSVTWRRAAIAVLDWKLAA